MTKNNILTALAVTSVCLLLAGCPLRELSKDARDLSSTTRDATRIIKDVGGAVKDIRSGTLMGEQNESRCSAGTEYRKDKNGDWVEVKSSMRCRDTSNQPGWGQRPVPTQ